MNKKLLKGKIMNIKRIIVLVLISASSGLLCAQRKTVNMSDRYGILTVTPLDKYTGAASLLKTNGVRSLTDVSYGDGFGGVSQKIHVGITPQGKDLTESYEYNSLGNLQSRTLPVPVLSEGASGNYKQILKSAQEYYGHSNVCSRFAYETALTETASEDAAKLSDALLQAGELPSAQEAADFYQAEVFKDMAELRLAVDEMETLTSRACWPYPTYGELLFSVR